MFRTTRSGWKAMALSVLAVGVCNSLASATPPEETPNVWHGTTLPDADTPSGSYWSESILQNARDYIGANDAQNNTWSPGRWHDRTAYARYYGKTHFVAHRGLVDLRNGITENSLDAVYNALDKRIFIIEIDVQATRDNVPMPLHDDTLSRVLAYGGNNRVDQSTYHDIRGETLLIQNPSGLHTESTARFCGNGNRLWSIADMIRMVNQNGAGGRCTARDDLVTWVFDPKNEKSAKAIMAFMTGTEYTSRTYRDSYVTKVYPDFYMDEGQTDAWNVASRIWAARETDATVKVIPIVRAEPYLASGDVAGAVELAAKVAEDWGQYFEVFSIEVPGAWHSNWDEFAYDLDRELLQMAKDGKFPKNPAGFFVDVGGAPNFHPRISAGYRFADFVLAGTYPSFQDGRAYDWSMSGQRQGDSGNKRRRQLGGTMGNWGQYCRRNLGNNGCWITTDYPVREFWKYKNNSNGADPVHNAPASNFTPNDPN